MEDQAQELVSETNERDSISKWLEGLSKDTDLIETALHSEYNSTFLDKLKRASELVKDPLFVPALGAPAYYRGIKVAGTASSQEPVSDKEMLQGVEELLTQNADAESVINYIVECFATHGIFDGAMGVDDMRDLAFRVGFSNRKVIVDFGQRAITWFGMTAEQAEQLGRLCFEYGRKVR